MNLGKRPRNPSVQKIQRAIYGKDYRQQAKSTWQKRSQSRRNKYTPDKLSSLSQELKKKYRRFDRGAGKYMSLATPSSSDIRRSLHQKETLGEESSLRLRDDINATTSAQEQETNELQHTI